MPPRAGEVEWRFDFRDVLLPVCVFRTVGNVVRCSVCNRIYIHPFVMALCKQRAANDEPSEAQSEVWPVFAFCVAIVKR